MYDVSGQILPFPRAASQAEFIFGPDEIQLMRRALENSWSALAFVDWTDESDRCATRERLARAILQAAAQGERRVPILSGHALGTIEPRCGGNRTWHVSRSAS